MTSKYHSEVEARMQRRYTRNEHGQFAVNQELAQVKAGSDTFRLILDDFVNGDKVRAIKLMNGIRPIDVMEYILGRQLTKEESTQYNECHEHVSDNLIDIFHLAREWQATVQTGRMYLRGRKSREVMLAQYKAFLTGLENGRKRVE
jgi:hypothetical protein